MSATKVIIIGANGRMGRALIDAVSENPAFELTGACDLAPLALPGGVAQGKSLAEALDLGASGVAIDFTAPEASLASAKTAAERGVKMVVGTTGFDARQRETLGALARQTAILWSANMSVGVNVLARLLPWLAKTLGQAYDMEIVETHHRLKKDAPSGTALMLAEALAEARGWDLEEARLSCRDGQIGRRPLKEIGVMALRGGDVAGIHDCYFLGPGEIIEVKHIAESRANFASGALRAAAWLQDKPGGSLYSMRDVLMD